MARRMSIDDEQNKVFVNQLAAQMGIPGEDITKLRGASTVATSPTQSTLPATQNTALPVPSVQQATSMSVGQASPATQALPIRGMSFTINPGGGSMEVALPNINITMPQADPQQIAQAAFDLFRKVYSSFPRLSGTIPFTDISWRDLTDFLAYKHALRYASPVAAMGQFIDATYMPARLAPSYIRTALEATALPYRIEELQTRTEELRSRRIPPDLAGEYLRFLLSSFPNFSLFLNEYTF
ncbi:MAG: hypothetical protein QXT86_08905 [Archaeoglobaceae archaeon]